MTSNQTFSGKLLCGIEGVFNLLSCLIPYLDLSIKFVLAPFGTFLLILIDRLFIYTMTLEVIIPLEGNRLEGNLLLVYFLQKTNSHLLPLFRSTFSLFFSLVLPFLSFSPRKQPVFSPLGAGNLPPSRFHLGISMLSYA